ncbi:hypothetical protein [Cohnella zeiphila]|uniref:DUF1349 domain-containing protein n=1 Tax=Cohnella zeiphila TaxID=2761120 RepID=A0A7X0VXK8_9BACL|nr:hypothetical protein [Cohnella zeiphila]MBB6733552.1 hypothetical protein [Cohnella zeiphila]
MNVPSVRKGSFILFLAALLFACAVPAAKVSYASVPTGWNYQDIGSPGLAGSSSFSGGTFTVSGSGWDIWGASDQFQFAYYPLNGDGTIVARVVSQQNTDGWAKAGVMIRESLGADAKFVAAEATPSNGVHAQYRTATGGNGSDAAGPASAAPVWLKLVRAGSSFSAYSSSDGVNWGTAFATVTVSMASSVYAGLAVTSHNGSSLSQATFTDVSNASGGSGGGSALPRTMGINIENPGDSSNLKIFANAYKTTRIGSPNNPTDGSYPIDSAGNPTGDFGLFMWDAGGFINDTQGTYAIQFTGSADVSVLMGDATMTTPVAYNSATNTSTGSMTVNTNSTVELRFVNTKRTAGSPAGSGVANVKIMRPVSPGSTTSYSTSTVFTTPFKDIITNDFHAKAIRYMDFTATNGKTAEANWSDRVVPANVQSLPGGTGYGWQGKGGSWEYAVMLANETNTDMWIDIPVAATDDYLTKLAQLIKYGSDGTNPYTSPQANPVYPPLNANLNVYVEYANELWNFAGAFGQSGWNLDRAVAEVNAGGSSLNYDGETNQWTWGWRRQARRTVEISNAFRSVFGDGAMMTRIRPVLEWQQGNGQNTAGIMLNFIDNWFGNRDGNHVSGPHPVNYYIWGGSGSAYYNPDNSSDSLSLSNIWTSQTYSTPNWAGPQSTDASYAAAFGLKRTAYEGGPSMDNTGHSEAVKESAWNDSRMASNVVSHQQFWEQYGGDVLMYFTFTGSNHSGYYQWEFVKDMNNPVTTSPKLQGIGTLNGGSKESATIGAAVGTSVDGNAWSAINRGWGTPGTGSLFMNGTDLRWASYNYHSGTSGTHSAVVAYSASAAAVATVFIDGKEAGTISAGAGSSTFTSPGISLDAGLHSVRVAIKSGSLTVNSVQLQ